MKKDERRYRLSFIYDTETTNLEVSGEHLAYPVLYIFNDVRECSICDYKLGDGNITFFRREQEVYNLIDATVLWGQENAVTPVIAAYNLMFDLLPLLPYLAKKYRMQVVAKSSTQVYMLDLVDERDNPILRFWDTFYLEMGGLAAMGSTCGIPKAKGAWDYTLIRTPDTPLTDDELFYAARDVEVIPCYLNYLCHANSWLTEDMFANKVMTKTSLVRQMAKQELYKLKRESKYNTGEYFMFAARDAAPKNYAQFALRKACFRGGFAFTAANYANTVMKNVTKIDTVSMHHTFINGMLVPRRFHITSDFIFNWWLNQVINTDLDYVLENYERPFKVAFHACIRFKNLRLKKGSAFEKWGIALLSEAKFAVKGTSAYDDMRNLTVDESIKQNGYKDQAYGAIFAFSKLMQAEVAELFINEIEFWCMAQVYEWDSLEILEKEKAISWEKAPDYVVLQSHILYERKNEMKYITNNYDGKPFKFESNTLPAAIVKSVNNGTADKEFLVNYYRSTVKGQFNAIFGAQAQVEYRPEYIVLNDGTIQIDEETIVSEDTFEDVKPKRNKVLYTYGMRIVGRSRMHLVIAIMLLWNRFGESVVVTGGDTDSLLVAKADGITPEDITDALKPIAEASEVAINKASARVRNLYPKLASDLKGVGSFDIEEENYPEHMEAWNKARISLDKNDHVHITLAGIPRPAHAYNIETLGDEYIERGYSFDTVAHAILGYNSIVSLDIAYYLEHSHPKLGQRFEGEVTDYLGNTSYVSAPSSIALYSTSKTIGDTSKLVNLQNVTYLESIGKEVDRRTKILKKGKIIIENEFGAKGVEL